jgi:hypothetical protein
MVLLAVSIFLTYYFHAILMLGTVFSHFFYVPIILTALWWEKRSVLVAIFLGGLVVVSSLLYRPEILTLNDYGRALMFVVIAFVVASLSEQLKGREQEVKKQRDLAQRYLDVAGGSSTATAASCSATGRRNLSGRTGLQRSSPKHPERRGGRSSTPRSRAAAPSTADGRTRSSHGTGTN